jgi:hypothetical protein
MKALSVLLLASISLPHVSIPPAHVQSSAPVQQTQAQRAKGKWYLARTGHAVYCYGPVMTVTSTSGDIERVATFCKGDRLLVPLKD